MRGPAENTRPNLSIEQLVARNPYNPDILPQLEVHVHYQVANQTYSLDANICLLRLYQFDPTKFNSAVVNRILMKAMMAMPAPDFQLSMCLIPDKRQQEEPFLTFSTLAHYLETCRFRDFWSEALSQRNREMFEAVPGFEQAIQSYAVHVLSITYRRVPRQVLSEAVNINGPSLDKFISHQASVNKWVVDAGTHGQVVIFPPNEDNHPVTKKAASDSIQFEQVARLFPILSK
eukprot:TRINITY_DN12118_c0_g2_i1.p1 TRINITY_DN12118_c0_g2~~TRINITY_DN12118_c0_g2_i1.p1  ORF type:complete len:232 (+),score=43.55 TRINITY_DN12118_c0_g2_i1:129-824(+)